jgi:hypothetical protein
MRQDIVTKQFVYKLVIPFYWGLMRNICWKGSHFFQQQEGVINQQKKGKKTLAGVEKAKYLPTVEVLVCIE